MQSDGLNRVELDGGRSRAVQERHGVVVEGERGRGEVEVEDEMRRDLWCSFAVVSRMRGRETDDPDELGRSHVQAGIVFCQDGSGGTAIDEGQLVEGRGLQVQDFVKGLRGIVRWSAGGRRDCL